MRIVLLIAVLVDEEAVHVRVYKGTVASRPELEGYREWRDAGGGVWP